MKTAPSKAEYGSSTVLSQNTLDAMEELGTVLKTIYVRMQKDGYRIVDGKMVNTNENETQATNN